MFKTPKTSVSNEPPAAMETFETRNGQEEPWLQLFWATPKRSAWVHDSCTQKNHANHDAPTFLVKLKCNKDLISWKASFKHAKVSASHWSMIASGSSKKTARGLIIFH
jgi:hypothetical protein